jgi:hypothetical protein
MAEKIGREFRAFIYIIMFCAVLWCFMVKGCGDDRVYCIESEDPEPEKNEFWPPDMVPHPVPPWEQPKDPNEGDLA